MRAVHVAIALIAAVAGAGSIHANVVGEGPSGIGPFTVGPARDVVLRPTGLRDAPDPRGLAADFGNPLGLPKARDDAFRLAQLVPSVPKPESTTGNPSLAPLKWAGLLVMPNPTQPNMISMCTAQFIKPNVLLTAGHCLKDLQTSPTGPWPDPTKGTFWLQYQDNSGTTFPIVCAATAPQYTLPSNYTSLTKAQQNAAYFAAVQHDFAMILVNGTSPTGVMPYALDWKGKVTYVTRVGYPADILDAAIVQKMGGPVFFANEIPIGLNSANLVVQWGPLTNFTGGSSGGAWIVNFNVNEGPNNNILVAVTSSEMPDYPGGEFAAYLTAAEFNPLLEMVQNGCK